MAEQRPPYLALSLLCGTALAHELLLIRLLAVLHWQPFAALVISLALLGVGAGGTALSLARRWALARFEHAFVAAAAGFGLGAPLSWAAAQALPFNALGLLWEPRQALWFMALYGLLALPFAAAAYATALCFLRFPAAIGRLYAADLGGAAAGVLAVLALLLGLPPMATLAAVAAAGLAAAALAAWQWRRRILAAGLALALPLAAGLTISGLAPRIGAYKPLAQALEVPGSRVLDQAHGPLAQLAVLAPGTIPLRSAPGASLTNRASLPEQLGLFSDGERLAALNRYAGQPEALDFLDGLATGLPYVLGPRRRVLLLGAGGGLSLLEAHRHGAEAVLAVDPDARRLDLLRQTYGDFLGWAHLAPTSRMLAADLRAYAAAPGPDYALIQLSLLEGGVAYGEHYALTVEALRAYWRRLADGGILSLSVPLRLPPLEALKLTATARAALATEGVAEPARHIAWVEGWRSASLFVRRGAYTAAEGELARRFCAERGFTLAAFPGAAAPDSALGQDAARLLGPEAGAFLADYPFALAPASDDAPYFHHFFRWRWAAEFWRLRERGGLALLDWGYPLLLFSLAQAALWSGLLIWLPLARRRPRGPGRGRAGLYFLCLGLGFMALEYAFLARLGLWLGHPLYAAAAVLAAFLLGAGLGSWRVESAGVARLGLKPFLGIVLFGGLAWLASGSLLAAAPGLPLPGRFALAVALILPLAFCLGMPMPLGLKRLAAADRELLPWAWAVNGCASVVGILLAQVVAMEWGLGGVVGLGLGCYGVAVAYRP